MVGRCRDFVKPSMLPSIDSVTSEGMYLVGGGPYAQHRNRELITIRSFPEREPFFDPESLWGSGTARRTRPFAKAQRIAPEGACVYVVAIACHE